MNKIKHILFCLWKGMERVTKILMIAILLSVIITFGIIFADIIRSIYGLGPIHLTTNTIVNLIETPSCTVDVNSPLILIVPLPQQQQTPFYGTPGLPRKS